MFQKKNTMFFARIFLAVSHDDMTLHLLWIEPVVDRRLVVGKASAERTIWNNFIALYLLAWFFRSEQRSKGRLKVPDVFSR